MIVKPVGRGKWTPMVLQYEGKHVLPLFVKVGAEFVLGGVRWRVHQVLDGPTGR